MPLPEGFPLTPQCNCVIDAASFFLLVAAPALSFALGYAVAWMRGHK
jgi:hypothetical protein